MPIFAFQVGLTLRRGNQLLDFDRRLDDGRIQFEDQLTRQVYTWEFGDVIRKIHRKELVVFRGETISEQEADGKQAAAIPLISSIEGLPKKARIVVNRKQDYIKGCQRRGATKGNRKLIAAAISSIASEIKDAEPPSASSVMAWWRDLANAEMSPGALVPKTLNRKSRRRIDRKVQELIRRVLRREYFTRKRNSAEHARVAMEAEVKVLKASKELPADTPKIAQATVYRFINEVDPYFRDVSRYGLAYARNKWRYSLGGAHLTRALERVECDHTLMDIVVVHDVTHMPLGRPTITVIVDAYSGYITGFFISFWGTGLGPTLGALRVSIMPKDQLGEAGSMLEHIWLGHGLGELIVVDNALEFHSPQFHAAAWELNADIQFCPVRQPWLKPVAERSLGVYNIYLPNHGTVEKALTNYLPSDPKKTAAITFSQLVTGLLRAFVDVHCMAVNDRKLAMPYDLFSESFAELPPLSYPTSFEQLDIIAGLSKEVTIGKEGAIFKYLPYNSRELQELRRGIGLTFKTKIKINPGNLGSVYVQDPRSSRWLLVPSLNPQYTEGLSLPQHQAIRAMARKSLVDKGAEANYMRVRASLMDMWNSCLKGSGARKDAATAARFGSFTSSEIIFGADVPERPPAEATVTPWVTPDDCPSSDDIPSFEIFTEGS